MNKLKVSTTSRVVSQKKNKIAKCIVSHPEGCTPSMIARETGINVNTVKSILPKLNNIESPIRGLYKVVNRGDVPYSSGGDLTNWNFHNLILSIPKYPYYDHDEIIDLNLIKLHINNGSIRVATDYPMNVSSICMIFGFLRSHLNLNISMSDILIKSIEFNKDYSNLKFEGVNCITLDGLCSQFKLYQKSIGLRTEHKTKLPFKADTMVDMLTGSPNHLELNAKLNQQSKILEKLTTQAIYNTAQLTKLIGASQ